VFAFRKEVTSPQIQALRDDALTQLFTRARRYQGKGCLNAVDNVREVIAPYFRGRELAGASFLDLDRALLQLERRTAERRGKLAAGAGDATLLMQRKQNLGMNAVLSVSLALARAIAYVRGRQLWELMREEMVGVIEKLADRHGVPIAGSRWEDYVAALREVTRILERKGVALHQELRGLTRVCEDPRPRGANGVARARRARAWRARRRWRSRQNPSPRPAPPFPRRARRRFSCALRDPQEALQQISLALHRSYVLGEDARERCGALRNYIRFRTETMRRVRPFEILNNKIVRDGERMLVAYLAGSGLLTHLVNRGRVEVEQRRLRRGTIVSDELLASLTGVRGEVIDLEEDLFGYDVESAPEVRVSRIRAPRAAQELDKTAVNRHPSPCLVAPAGARSRGFLERQNCCPKGAAADAEPEV
jgi:hypothetical protein